MGDTATLTIEAGKLFQEPVSTSFKLEEATDKTGSKWKVTIIEEGESRNGRYYPIDVLRESLSLFDNTPMYAASGEDHSSMERGVRSIVGFIKSPKIVGNAMEGVAHITDASLRSSMKEWNEAGVLDKMVGLSISAMGKSDYREGKEVMTALLPESVDIVRDPAAGGKFQKMLESLNKENKMGDTILTDDMKKEIAEAAKAAVIESLPAVVAEAMKVAREAEDAADAEKKKKMKEEEEKKKKTKKTEEGVDDELTEQATAIKEALRISQETALANRITEAKLPSHSADRVKSIFDPSKPIDFSKVEEAIKSEKDYLAKHEVHVVESITEQGGTVRSGKVTAEELDKKLARWQATYERDPRGFSVIKIGDSDEKVRPYISFREAFHDFHGEAAVGAYGAGDMWRSWCSGVVYDSASPRNRDKVANLKRFQESLGTGTSIGGVTGTVTTNWSSVAGDQLYQMLIKNYMDQPRYQDWRKIAKITSSPDFRPQHRMKIGEYSDLPVVNEAAQYSDIAHPGDEETTIQVVKRGYHAPEITRELMYNDRIDALAVIPMELGRAAARTLYKAIFVDLFQSDYQYTVDTAASNLFIAGKNNLRANAGAALSIDSLDDARVAMRKQTRYSAATEILGAENLPKFIIVPAALEGITERIVNPSGFMIGRLTADTGTMQDISRFKGLEMIVVDEFTSDVDWFTMADPALVTGIEVSFLGGRQEPDLIVQSAEEYGDPFEKDAITYKIRHEWGRSVHDYRPFYKNDVG